MSKNDNLPEDIIYSEATVGFAAAANEFCKILESAGGFSLKNFIENIYKITSLIHVKALSLPDTEDTVRLPSETFITEADWHYINSAISRKLGEFDIYGEVREPANPETPAAISMSECLTDIYQDLKDFLKIYQIGTREAILSALEDCKESFRQFWGPRLISVMNEFHILLYGNEELKETDTPENKNNKPKGNNWVDNLFNN